MRLIDANKLKRKVQRVATEAWMMKLTSSVETVLNQFLDYIEEAPNIDICFCRECIYYDPPHVEDKGKRIEYNDLPEEAFDELGTGLVNLTYGINIGGRCCVDYNCGYAEDKRVYRTEDDFCSRGERKDDE